MSKQQDYSEAEWKAIAAAPVASGLLVTLSDASGPMGIAKEAMAVTKAISDSATMESPEIVKAVADAVKSGAGRPELQDLPKTDRAKLRDALFGVIKTAVGTVQAKSPAELESYKAWLASVATKAAEAAKEGG